MRDPLDCIVADDEPNVRQRVARLAEHCGLIVRAMAADGAQAEALIRRHEPALAFLDIRMPVQSGLDAARALSNMDAPPVIVFVTAFDEHATTAFELAAIDYVVKPVETERFEIAVERARQTALARSARQTLDRIGTALEMRGPDRLTFRSGSGLVAALPKDIVRFQAMDDYVEAHLAGAAYLLSLTMKALQSVLPSPPFLRVHRSHIVHLDHVKAMRVGPGRTGLEMDDGSFVPVSKEKMMEVRAEVAGIGSI